jgi:hypothetical protein
MGLRGTYRRFPVFRHFFKFDIIQPNRTVVSGKSVKVLKGSPEVERSVAGQTAQPQH